jgi:hypothetical protein
MALGGEPRQHVAPQLEPSPPVQLQYSICRKRPSIPRQRHQYRLLHSSLLRASDTHLPVIRVFQLPNHWNRGARYRRDRYGD